MKKLILLAAISFILVKPVFATTYALPAHGNNLVGQVQHISAKAGDTLLSIGEQFNVGFDQISEANASVNPMAALPAGFPVRVPLHFILPELDRRGIIINLPEMRLYYYPANGGTVMTFPIGIGRIGKTIPIERTTVTRKAMNPTWYPPADIRTFVSEEQGITLPRAMPAGPDNPLGPYGIYLGIPTFLIHSTIFPESVGRRASFGCIRMRESDIKQFFPLMTPGLPVVIVDTPTKIGWQGTHIYLEAHPPLEERNNQPYASLDGIVKLIENNLPRDHVVFVDWQLVAYLTKDPDGLPHEIGFAEN